MREDKIGNNKYLKEMNQSTVLDLIRTNEGMSRKALADKTGLSPTATGAIVRTLLKEKYIREVGEGKSSGGRKPVILEINPDSYFAFGFDVDVKFIYTVVLDITGKICYEGRDDNNGPITPEEGVKRIGDTYRSVAAKLKLKEERILGAGVSIAGMLDLTTRKILLAPNIGWSGAEIHDSLKKLLNIPVYIENEAMCSAFCENWLGICKGVEDFICINIESGIGAGIFIGGNIYRGHTGSAGEVGHISVDENGPRCKCGNTGCLETIASVSAMVSRYRTLKGTNQGESSQDEDFNDMLEYAGKGDELCLKILSDAAASLGKAIGYIINAFNPQQIVLGKKFPKYAKYVLEEIRDIAKKTSLTHPAKNCHILPSKFGENSSALGAAIMPVRRLFGQ